MSESRWTTRAEPIVLTAIPDDANNVSSQIGPEGGTLETTGADGTKYVLDIPAGALGLPVTIGMSPIDTLEGFPDEIAPEHRLGVILTPEGLEFGIPASLKIDPDTEVPVAGVHGIDFHGMSSAAGFHLFDRSESAIVMAVDHFSTVGLAFVIDTIPRHLRDRFLAGLNRTLEEQLAAEVAYYLGILRQQQLLGVESGWTERDIARATLSTYRRLVIGERVAVADKSCANASAAMAAYLQYQRQRQLLGVVDDPEFDLGELGGGMLVPAALLELAVEVCFKEAYERCARTGDFPSMVVYFFTLISRFRNLLGADPTPESIALAQDYMRRCGRWRVKLSTTHDKPAGGTSILHNDAVREFHIQWQPGSGELGIVGSTIEGSGPVEALSITKTSDTCTSTISNIRSTQDAKARIAEIAFDHYEGPTLTGDPIPPVPSQLKLVVNLGKQAHHEKCEPYGADYDIDDQFYYVYGLLIESQGLQLEVDEALALLEGKGEVEVGKDWQFRTNPYKATNVFDDDVLIGIVEGQPVSAHARIEVIVEHEPQ